MSRKNACGVIDGKHTRAHINTKTKLTKFRLQLPITGLLCFIRITGFFPPGIIPRWKNDGRELFLGGKTTGGNYS